MEMMEFVFRIQKKSTNTRKDSRKDTGRPSVLEMFCLCSTTQSNDTLEDWMTCIFESSDHLSGCRVPFFPSGV